MVQKVGHGRLDSRCYMVCAEALQCSLVVRVFSLDHITPTVALGFMWIHRLPRGPWEVTISWEVFGFLCKLRWWRVWLFPEVQTRFSNVIG